MGNHTAKGCMLPVWEADLTLLPDIKINVMESIDGILITLCSWQFAVTYVAFHTGTEDVFLLQHFKNRFCILAFFRGDDSQI